MHFCQDEAYAIMASIPFIGHFFRRIHTWYHAKIGHPCHTDGCQQSHSTHTEVSDNSLPIEEWDPISLLDVEERFGVEVVDDLIGNPQLLKIMTAPPENEFAWFVNQNGALMAHWGDRRFLHFGKDVYGYWTELPSEQQ